MMNYQHDLPRKTVSGHGADPYAAAFRALLLAAFSSVGAVCFSVGTVMAGEAWPPPPPNNQGTLPNSAHSVTAFQAENQIDCNFPKNFSVSDGAITGHEETLWAATNETPRAGQWELARGSNGQHVMFQMSGDGKGIAHWDSVVPSGLTHQAVNFVILRHSGHAYSTVYSFGTETQPGALSDDDEATAAIITGVSFCILPPDPLATQAPSQSSSRDLRFDLWPVSTAAAQGAARTACSCVRIQGDSCRNRCTGKPCACPNPL